MRARTRIAAIATLLLLGCVSTVTAVGELKAIDFGEVVAAEHHDVSGVVAMGMMKGLRTSDVKITLVVNGGQSVATRVKPDGSFALLDVPPGSHLLETFALGYSFPPMTVRIGADGTIRAAYAEDPTVRFESPLVLKPVSAATYFEHRQGLSLGSLAKNPMFLMVAFTVLMAWAMPKLMESMDPEELKEMQEKMGAMGAQPSMGDLFSGKMFEDAKAQAEASRGNGAATPKRK